MTAAMHIESESLLALQSAFGEVEFSKEPTTARYKRGAGDYVSYVNGVVKREGEAIKPIANLVKTARATTALVISGEGGTDPAGHRLVIRMGPEVGHNDLVKTDWFRIRCVAEAL